MTTQTGASECLAIDAFFDGFEEVITPIRFWVPADEKQALGNPLRDAIERRNSLSEKSLLQ